VEDVLDRAVPAERWDVVRPALAALAGLGEAAAPALPVLRALAEPGAAADPSVAPAAVAALRAAGAGAGEVLPGLLAMLGAGSAFRAVDVAGLLGSIGPEAAAAAPRLRELLDDGHDWVRVRCAAALWEIGGEPEAPAVLGALLPAWERNPAVGNHVVRCLAGMGTAAAPAVPILRAQLELPRRVELFAGVAEDEELQAGCRGLLARLTRP
ncbi:HEAT repeat domain-containing protein, partial [Kitasatospora sp. NPDC056327]